MSKKLYEIARELKVESKEIILRMGEEGVRLLNHLVPVDKDLEDRIKEVFKKQRVGDVETVEITTTVKRRRAVKEQSAPEPAAQQAEKKSEAAQDAVAAEIAGKEKVKRVKAAEEEVKSERAAQAKEKGDVAAAKKPGEVSAQEIDEFPVQKQLVIIEEKKEEKKEESEEDKAKEKKPLKAEEKTDKKTKGRRLIYDRRRDVISLRDFDEIVELELPTTTKKKRIVKGKKTHRQVITVSKPSKRVIKMTSDAIQVGELAHIMGVKGGDVVRKLIDMGMMVTVVNSIDFDTAFLVAQEFDYTVEKAAFDISEYIKEVTDKPEDLEPRAPVVTIMGHVDHGKTTLLDRIRETRVAEGEAGGITQHIGAYRVRLPRGEITFLDTPGHEAFTAMRARGAKVTDIVILVVAADDGVKAQTVEAINHAREAEVPIIVAVNKIDKPEANVEKVKKELMDFNLIPEDWGGSTIFAEISAKHNRGIENLLEMILLQAEVLELDANPGKPAKGIVLESRLDRGKGAVATVVVQEGTLRPGDIILCGISHGRVRLLIDDTGKNMKEAKPSQPALVVGWDVPPRASEFFNVLDDEKKIKPIIEHLKLQEQKEKAAQAVQRVSLEDLFKQVQMGVVKDLKIVLKADVQGF
ncbi:MAG: translation initiation factor IF-2, partial [Deltaproteobacteria bacterium]|nr:translation initiation factor IF-2 [Deltaproteobacteria bacterium]